MGQSLTCTWSPIILRCLTCPRDGLLPSSKGTLDLRDDKVGCEWGLRDTQLPLKVRSHQRCWGGHGTTLPVVCKE